MAAITEPVVALIVVTFHVESVADIDVSVAVTVTPEPSVAALDAGIHSIGKKILEEAGEVWLAAEHESDEALAEEISQLIYHLQTLMLARGLSINDIYKFL